MIEYTCSFVDPVEKLHWMTFVDQPKERIDSFARYLKGTIGWRNIVIWFYHDHSEKRLEDYLTELEGENNEVL